MSETPDYTAAIERGVARLDAELGRANWLPQVDPEDLDMGMPFGPCGCVCAQLFGKFSAGLDRLGIREREPGDYAQDYGFDSCNYVALTTQWKAKLAQLRQEEGL
jgi:hypothetical protein